MRDCNGNGVADSCDLAQGSSQDCNANDTPDECDIAQGTSPDCNANGIPDECIELKEDCNGNGVPDSCDIAEGTSEDCNENIVPDACDIAEGTSEDCTADGIPDECEPDCNENDVADSCDIAAGTSEDCNANAIPDECDIARGTSEDCNGNGVVDSCDIAEGTSQDINGNGVPDECESDCNGNGIPDDLDIGDGTSEDCNENEVPDECDFANGTSEDCNGNVIPDECDIAEGTSQDCTANGIPDQCDIVAGTSEDCNENAIPDECDLLFIQQIITTAATWPISVFSADLDGDGDNDVLSASYFDGKIAWYRNTDGLGSFGPQQIITIAADYAYSVFVADLDGDGDPDVLSASAFHDKIAWYENTDGLGSFGPQQIITTEADWALSVFAADLDGDGDHDVLSASNFDDKIAWYENIDGLGSFGPQQIITTEANDARSVFAADLDGDGNTDVLSASNYDDKIAWYRNTDGLGTFGPQQIITTAANGAFSVFAADLDGDGDNDVLSASSVDDQIAWYETPSDCNGNAIPDVCDIAAGTSEDCNGNGKPDECELDVRCPCEGDVNRDGTVDPLDSGFVLSRFGCPVGEGHPGCDAADQNGDGMVDPLDVGFILARFGDCEE